MRRLVPLAVGVTVAWHAVLFASAELLPPLGTQSWPDTGATVVNLVAALVPLALVVRCGWWRRSWLRRVKPRAPWLLAPAVAAALLPAVQGIEGTSTVLVSSAALFVCLGVSEELTSRGVVQEILSPLEPARQVLSVGALFGLGHVLSAAWFHRPIDDTVAQVISATTFGVGYAALRLRTDAVWPLMLLHGVDDWAQVNSPGAMAWPLQLGEAILWLVYGLFLVRPSATSERGPASCTAPQT